MKRKKEKKKEKEKEKEKEKTKEKKKKKTKKKKKRGVRKNLTLNLFLIYRLISLMKMKNLLSLMKKILNGILQIMNLIELEKSMDGHVNFLPTKINFIGLMKTQEKLLGPIHLLLHVVKKFLGKKFISLILLVMLFII